MLRGELVNRNSREKPVYSKCRDGLVFRNVGVRSPVLRGELVNEICREEPICLKYSEGLVFITSRSPSAYVKGRARQ